MTDHIPPPASLPPGAIVWAYLRDSGGEGQEQSVPQQRSELEAYCTSYGLSLNIVFADVARSGGSVVGRENFQDMVDTAADPNARPDGLLLWNFARFARDLEDSIYYKSLLRRRGMVIHSLTDPIPAGAIGRVMEVLTDYANEEKRLQTSRDVKRALAALVRQGFSSGGFPPRGYRAEKVTIGHKRNGTPRIVSRWVEDPELGPLCKLAWEMRAQRKSYDEITEATQGQLYKNHGGWTTFFSNKTYLGIGKCGALEVHNHHTAAVDQATWDAVQKIQRETRQLKKKGLLQQRHPRVPYLLAGLAACIHCGSAMVFDRSGKTKWGCYLCGKKRRQGWHSCKGRMINAREAETAILDKVLSQVLTADFLPDLLANMSSQLANTTVLDQEAERLAKEMADCERAIQNLLDLAETFGAKTAGDRLREREAEHSRLTVEMRLLESKRTAAQVEITPEALSVVLAAWRGEFDGAVGDVRALRRFLSRFVAKIELGYTLARVWYTYPLDGLIH
jgi:site-specific DNA recombinase